MVSQAFLMSVLRQLSAWVYVAIVALSLTIHTAASAPDVAKTDAQNPGKLASNELVLVPSVFVDKSDASDFGKDIFFPKTKRFQKKVEVPGNMTAVQQGETALIQSLVLKGVSGNSVRRLAMVNNRTMGEGEVWDYKHLGQVYRIRCEEIKPRSVLISIEGVAEKKELQLRGGL